MIAKKDKFLTGMILMVLFTGVFVAIFMPLFGGRNGLQYLDNLYNSISKGSANYIDAARAEVQTLQTPEVTLNLTMKSEIQAEQAVPLFMKAGAQVGQNGVQLAVTGNIVQILNTIIDDSKSMYDNDGEKVSQKYGYAEKAALFNWWSALKAMDSDLKKQKLFKVAKVAETVKSKAVEPAYNYYGIEAQKITDKLWVVIFSLAFYVIYTLWYGFGIMYLFEGVGMQLEH